MRTRNYDREFKLNAVKPYRKSQTSMSTICKDLEIPISTLSGRVKEFASHAGRCHQGKRHLKKSHSHLLKTQRDKTEFMVKNKDIFPLKKMAKMLGVARSSYYLPQKPSKRCY
jgi:transposase-like protein